MNVDAAKRLASDWRIRLLISNLVDGPSFSRSLHDRVAALYGDREANRDLLVLMHEAEGKDHTPPGSTDRFIQQRKRGISFGELRAKLAWWLDKFPDSPFIYVRPWGLAWALPPDNFLMVHRPAAERLARETYADMLERGRRADVWRDANDRKTGLTPEQWDEILGAL